MAVLGVQLMMLRDRINEKGMFRFSSRSKSSALTQSRSPRSP